MSQLYTEIADSCHRGSYTDTLFPHSIPINARGSWSHRANEMPTQPTIYHGRFAGARASGTIDDIVDPSRGRRCHGHTSFHATRSDPVGIGPATVGGRGTDVELNVTMPPASNGNALVPYTPTALLVYGSTQAAPRLSGRRCAREVRELRRLHRAYLGRLCGCRLRVQPYELAYVAYRHGVFTFHVASNTVVPDAAGQSPFSTVCVMLYSGQPASLTPSANTALATTQAPLVPGPGIPDNQTLRPVARRA